MFVSNKNCSVFWTSADLLMWAHKKAHKKADMVKMSYEQIFHLINAHEHEHIFDAHFPKKWADHEKCVG